MKQLLILRVSNTVIAICSLVHLTFCSILLGTFPPFIDVDAHSKHGHIITAFYCVLGYLGMLALGSFTMAFLSRNLPDTINEAKFLTFSMLVFCSVWVTFLPVNYSTKGKVMVAVDVFSILASSVGLQSCIFAAKCFIIIIKPKNSLKDFNNRKYSKGL